MRIFGREPALWAGLLSALIQLVSAFIFPLSDEQQGVLNALTVAILGVITAFAVSSERGVPALLGAIKAVLAVGLSFGLHLTPMNQAVIMTFAAAVAAFIVRDRVTAPVPAEPPRAA